jgi:hypothetical protein
MVKLIRIVYPHKRWGRGFDHVPSRYEQYANDVVWLPQR